MQTALMNHGASIIANKKVTPTSNFRYAIIDNDSLSETKIFQYPMAIHKLTLFIMEAYQETKVRSEDKPMVL
jgi:hypothetical protein